MKQCLTRFSCALIASVCVHAVLLFSACALFRASDKDVQVAADELVRLDVTSVDLSFSDEERDAEPPSVAQPASPESLSPPPPPVTESRLSEPPPLTVRDSDVTVTAADVDELRRTELKPLEPEAPEMIPEEIPPPPETQNMKVEESSPHDRSESVAAAANIPAPKQARVDAPPAPRRTIRPKYPDGARKRGEQGDVALELEVDVHGVVVGVQIVGGCGFAELEQAALNAVRKAMFRPAKSGGKAVSSRARLTLTFRLNK